MQVAGVAPECQQWKQENLRIAIARTRPTLHYFKKKNTYTYNSGDNQQQQQQLILLVDGYAFDVDRGLHCRITNPVLLDIQVSCQQQCDVVA